MSLLSDLADKYGTDKRYSEHNYVTIYERLFDHKRLKINKMLEVGYGSGGSVKMWMDYFPNADVYCMEYCDEEYKEVWHNPKLDLPDLDLIIGDSTKPESWVDVPNELDLIVEDGSHFPEHQIATFMNGFPHVASGGLYIIEDLHCSFEEKYGNTKMVYEKFFDYIIEQQTPGRNYGGNFYQCRGAMPEVVRDIYSYSFYKSIIIIQKA